MARVVLTPYGTYGDVLPYVAIARGLQARGHDPVIAGPATYDALVARDGVEFRAVRPDVAHADPDDWRRVMDRRTGGTAVIRERLLPALRQSYEDLLPVCRDADVLVSHTLSYATPIVAETERRPWLSTVLMPLSFMSAHDPPVIASARWLARLRPLGPRVVASVWRILKSYTRTWSRPVQALRAELGLAPHPDPLFEGQFSSRGVLALFSPLLAPPQPDWPPGTTACGFAFYEGDFGGDPGAHRLRAFLAEGPPPLVFSLGSAAAPGGARFHAIAAACAGELGERAVLVVGGARAPVPLPERVIAVESAALTPLFEGASVVIHAGGAGTTGLALRAGCPQLVVPFVHDQFDSARRVARLGVGLELDSRRLSPRRVRRLLAALLEDSAMRARAGGIAATVRAERGVETACDAIEQAMAESPTPSRPV